MGIQCNIVQQAVGAILPQVYEHFNNRDGGGGALQGLFASLQLAFRQAISERLVEAASQVSYGSWGTQARFNRDK